jgi:hypothetical protein
MGITYFFEFREDLTHPHVHIHAKESEKKAKRILVDDNSISQ